MRNSLRSKDTAAATPWRRVAVAVTAMTAALVLASGAAASASPPVLAKKAPQLSAAQPGTLVNCVDLIGFEFDATEITSAELVPAGTLTNAGSPSASTAS